MKIAVVGATGLVGRKILEVLSERDFPVDVLVPVARSTVGSTIDFKGAPYTVLSMEDALDEPLDIAIFSAGGQTSKEWAPKFAEHGVTVIDNSSAWRMEEGIPLVVPEVNAHVMSVEDHIIANPNCSTIQLMVAMKPLHDAYGIERMVISTYQSVTGTGKAAVEQLERERKGESGADVYPHPIDQNCIPHCDIFLENDYTKEEVKLVQESRKILGEPELRVTATAVRVPVVGGHSESVNVQFEKEFDIEEAKEILAKAPGLVLQDDPEANSYPMPIHSHEKDEVFVGRIRRDESQDRTMNLWVVADNLRKGAATNAVQIAEYLISKGLR
jgi:aspartate-semialdehyde dehydrogenase